MSDQHAPLPWSVEDGDGRNSTVWGILASDGGYVVVPDFVSRTNAELIVRAVNSHDELLHELKHLVALLEPMELDGGLPVPGLATLNGARAAIAKAEGR